jgi:hypothetical protein
VVLDGFAGFGQGGCEELAIGLGRESGELGRAQGTGDEAGQQLAEGFEFEKIGASLHAESPA